MLEIANASPITVMFSWPKRISNVLAGLTNYGGLFKKNVNWVKGEREWLSFLGACRGTALSKFRCRRKAFLKAWMHFTIFSSPPPKGGTGLETNYDPRNRSRFFCILLERSQQESQKTIYLFRFSGLLINRDLFIYRYGE